jgi:hypothetical protein
MILFSFFKYVVVAHLKMLQSKKANSSTSIDDFVVEGEIDDWLKDDDIKENKKQKFVTQSEVKATKSTNSHFRKNQQSEWICLSSN